MKDNIVWVSYYQCTLCGAKFKQVKEADDHDCMTPVVYPPDPVTHSKEKRRYGDGE